MTYNTYDTDEFALPLPITQVVHRTAQQFSSQQPSPEKQEQVRFNTLAVGVVNDYLQLMGLATDLRTSDSWNPVVRLCADVADLNLPGLGRLECRAVRSGDRTCTIPPDVWVDRIGYVVVQIDDAAQEAELLGFVPSVAEEELLLSRLRSPEDLLEHLDQLRQCATVSPPSPAPPHPMAAPPAKETLVRLGQWLQGIVDEGWQTVESLLNPLELSPAYTFRGIRSTATVDEPALDQPEGTVRRAKLIDFGLQPAHQPVALVVEIHPTAGQQTDIHLQVYPTGQDIFLPQGLKLRVLDEAGLTFLEAQARLADNYIQLQFSGDTGEPFSVQIQFNDASIAEAFVV
jgi:hypothetical protein